MSVSTARSTLVACLVAIFVFSSGGCSSDYAPAGGSGVGGIDESDFFADGSCDGVVEGGTVENLIVDDGATCVLDGTHITGNLFVYTGSTLVARDIRVGGNIQTEGATSVEVMGSTTVEGNIQIEQGGSGRIDAVRIGGDLQLEQNHGSLVVTSNVVDGNLQAFQNTGGVTLTANRVAENLQCKENSPAPAGGDNTAGSKEDQCEAL